ncbi:MAG: hypothetical protein M3438_07025 [Pseudomonadota bacterium]|nr:hypothetical protein [Pseudomonadota bacterium]
MTIPVICDRCRSTGTAGQGDFTHLGDLLEFVPVPRKYNRADGWSAERQRAFIAALSATGSKRRAAMAIGMAPFGVDQLLKAKGADSFKAAYDRAMAIAKAEGSVRIAAGVADAAARNAQLTPPSRLRGHEPEPEPEMDEDSRLELIERIANKFLRKVVVEREARLGGEIAAADFYLRQITHMEVMFDLMSSGVGLDPWYALSNVQRGGQAMVDIAETPFSQWLDAHRREYWASSGEPMRPVSLRPEYLHDHGTHSTEPSSEALGQCTDPPPGVEREAWAAMGYDEQVRVRAEVYARAAAEQVAYEEAARREYEERRGRDAFIVERRRPWPAGLRERSERQLRRHGFSP